MENIPHRQLTSEEIASVIPSFPRKNVCLRMARLVHQLTPLQEVKATVEEHHSEKPK